MKIKIKKGLDLDLAGKLSLEACKTSRQSVPTQVAIVPDDFPGFTPKLDVKEGDKVVAGQPLMHDKRDEQTKLVSPVGGTVKAVVRGERRKVERVVVEVALSSDAVKFDTAVSSREEVVALLGTSGMLARMRQRPYDIVPHPEVAPRDIFVTAIDRAPLSPGMDAMLAGKADALKAGVALLKKVTDGKVYLSVGADWTLGDIPGAEMVEVEGPHPAGNAGVQAANIAPVNKGETIWTLDAVTLCKIGQLMTDGTVDGKTLVAVTGAEVSDPCLLDTIEGADMASVLSGRLKESDHHVRVISGNPLTGTAVSATEGFLRFPYRQVTVIPEGDDANEFMGWASLSPKKMSTSPSFLGHFFGKAFNPDARILGGRRAMIMSGQYDKYVPMDILPEYLLKAIIAKDIEGMEKLGIYEVAPEDFAVAEFADTSKLPLQQIVRDGLDYLRKELE